MSSAGLSGIWAVRASLFGGVLLAPNNSTNFISPPLVIGGLTFLQPGWVKMTRGPPLTLREPACKCCGGPCTPSRMPPAAVILWKPADGLSPKRQTQIDLPRCHLLGDVQASKGQRRAPETGLRPFARFKPETSSRLRKRCACVQAGSYHIRAHG